MTKDELNINFSLKFEKLTQRAKNILSDLSIDNFEDYYNDFILNGRTINLIHVRNCGNKTKIELDVFLKELKTHSAELIKLVNEKQQEETKFGFKINLMFLQEFNKLSVRARNVLLHMQISDINSFYKHIIQQSSSNKIKNFRNCGEKTLKEILLFETKVKGIIKFSKMTIKHKGLFSDIEFYLFEGGNFKEIDFDIMLYNLSIIKDEIKKTRLEIGNDHKLTRERVRQITNKIPNKIEPIIRSLAKNTDYYIFNYFKDDSFFISDEIVEQINSSQNTNFSKGFIIFIFDKFNHPDYTFINQGSKLPNYHGIFIRNDISFQFEKCFEHINKFHCSRRKQDLILSLENIFDLFKKGRIEFETKNRIIKILDKYAKFVTRENNIIELNRESILLKKNTIKQKYEYLIEILRDYKKPMHFTDLFEECIQRNVKITSASSTHSAMQNHPEIFGLKGPGVYGLLEWGGYFGKIGDVTEKKLRELNEPMDRKELEEFLVRELYISQDSIREVLLNYDLEDRFIKLKSDKISLKEWL